MAYVLPMFPLGTVVVPGGVLPLHVFEPRYRELVAQCLQMAEPEFGVVLIARGREVGGGDTRCTTATAVRIAQLAELPGGRFAMLTIGQRRLAVREWLADDPYPRALVEDWPDGASTVSAADLADRAAHVRRCLALAVELGDLPASPAVELSADPSVATFQLAAALPAGPADTYRLLEAPSAAHRMAVLDEVLADLDNAQRFRLG